MKTKQKYETTHYYNVKTDTWDTWQLPTPEYVPDYSGIIDGVKALSAFVLVVFVIGHSLGVI